ncbi:S-layer homology domain-containing protein [Halanaerobaculum tunisiense]
MRKLVTIMILTSLLVVNLTTAAIAYRPPDVKGNHWALEYISPLLDQGVMYVYQDDNFRPNQSITRGEFAYSLAKALELQPSIVSQLTDIANHPAKGYISALVNKEIITGYPDQTFRPDRRITRAEIMAMLTRSLQLNEEEKQITLNSDFYPDVAPDHWAQNLISLSTRLGLIDGYPSGKFKPNNYVTRAESSKLLVKLTNLEPVDGQIVETYPTSRIVKIKTDNQVKTYHLADNNLIGRNNRLVDLDEMLVSDDAFLILNQQEKVTYLKAYGLIKEKDIAEKLSDMTGETLSSDQLIAIAKGKWEEVTPGLKQKLEMSLLEQGLTAQEVQAVLSQDWDTLQETSKIRLVETISLNTNIPRSIVQAVADQDWEQAKKAAQTTALNSALKQVMNNSDLLS